MVNKQEKIAVPVKCPVCGYLVVRRDIITITSCSERYREGVWQGCHVRSSKTTSDECGEWYCTTCEHRWTPLGIAEEILPKLSLTVEKDICNISPRTIGSPLTKMYILHPVGLCTGDLHQYHKSNFADWDAFREYIVRYNPIGVIKPLYYYPHNTSLSFKGPLCHEINYQVGYIFVTTKCALDAGLTSNYAIEEAMVGEVDRYNRYLQGLIWRYVIRDETGKEVKSMGGFYDQQEAQKVGEKSMSILESN